MNRDMFINGAAEALPFIQDLAQNYAYTKMSHSQTRYLNYFNQVLLYDFTPLSNPLVLSKILLVFEEEDAPQQPAVSSFDGEQDADQQQQEIH